MMKRGLLREIVPTYNITTQAAGTGTDTGATLDMQGFDGALFLLCLGDNANTSVVTVKAYHDTASGMGTEAQITGTATVTCTATSADDKMLALDVSSISKRYLRFKVVKGTANATVEAGVAIKYNAKKLPIGTTAGDLVNSATIQG